jgi:hypothetical protein
LLGSDPKSTVRGAVARFDQGDLDRAAAGAAEALSVVDKAELEGQLRLSSLLAAAALGVPLRLLLMRMRVARGRFFVSRAIGRTVAHGVGSTVRVLRRSRSNAAVTELDPATDIDSGVDLPPDPGDDPARADDPP